MNRIRQAATLAVALGLAASACSTTRVASSPAPPASAPQAAAKAESRTPYPVNFIRDNFPAASATVTNPWFPLTVGRQWIWEGTALDGEDEIERKVVFTVTDLTKTIAGVETLVGWDRDYNDGVLVEEELIFFAQDKTGNVWHFGQYAEKYDEEGNLDGAVAWLVGYLADAKAGIMMKASPRAGDPAYSEGYAPHPYNWDDFGRPIEEGESMCVPVGCYDDVLVIEEFEPPKTDATQLKYYARGVGVIAVGWDGDEEAEQEEMELKRLFTLTPAGMAEAREAAIKLEARGDVYGLSAPIRQRPAATPTPTASS